MKKYTAFKVVSIIYMVLAILLIAFSIFTFIDYSLELGVLGYQASGRYESFMGFYNMGGIIFLSIGIFILIPLLISFVLVIVSSKKGTTKIGYFVPSLVVGALGSLIIVCVPLYVFSLIAMINCGKEQKENENKKSKTTLLVISIIMLSLSISLFITSLFVRNVSFAIASYCISIFLFLIGVALLIIYIVMRARNKSAAKSTLEHEVNVENESVDTIEMSNYQDLETLNSLKFKTDEKFKLQVNDFFISSKDFRQFKNSASEDELITVALSIKYQMSGIKALIKCLIAFVGAPLSIILGVLLVKQIAWFAIALLIVGYIASSILSLKQIGYESTYRACYKKLSEENKQFVKQYFKEPIWLYVINTLVRTVLFFETIPYQAILMLITTLIPQSRNWGIAKGSIDSVVVATIKGYEIGQLEELNGYYQSFSFYNGYMTYLSEAEKERIAKYKPYRSQDGKTYYSDDGKNFYKKAGDTGNPIAISEDGGKTIVKNK